MKLEGMHHITMITGDATKNVALDQLLTPLTNPRTALREAAAR
jgi:hypothetical protein